MWNVHSCFQWYEHCTNRPRNARVIVENKTAPFFPDTVYLHYAYAYDRQRRKLRTSKQAETSSNDDVVFFSALDD